MLLFPNWLPSSLNWLFMEPWSYSPQVMQPKKTLCPRPPKIRKCPSARLGEAKDTIPIGRSVEIARRRNFNILPCLMWLKSLVTMLCFPLSLNYYQYVRIIVSSSSRLLLPLWDATSSNSWLFQQQISQFCLTVYECSHPNSVWLSESFRQGVRNGQAFDGCNRDHDESESRGVRKCRDLCEKPSLRTIVLWTRSF